MQRRAASPQIGNTVASGYPAHPMPDETGLTRYDWLEYRKHYEERCMTATTVNQSKTDKVLSSAAMALVALMMLATWVFPSVPGGDGLIRTAGAILCLETALLMTGFFVTAAISSVRNRFFRILVFIAVTGFLFGRILVEDGIRNAGIVYLAVIGTRLRFLVFTTDIVEQSAETMLRFIAEIVLLILAVLVSVVIPWPALGLTPEVLDRCFPDRGTALFAAEPQRALVAGIIYFPLAALVEQFINRRLGRQP